MITLRSPSWACSLFRSLRLSCLGEMTTSVGLYEKFLARYDDDSASAWAGG